MQDEIKIQAQILSESVCQFNVDRKVYDEGTFLFSDREKASNSPLAAKIFKIEDIESVLISEKTVRVTKTGKDDWVPVAKKIGNIIREQLKLGEPAVSEEYLKELPPEAEIREKVNQLINEQINPAIAAHGGYIRLLDVKKNDLFLEMGGGCQGCGMASMTLKQGIERMIRQNLPYVGQILDSTDHAAGTNPFYTS